jgi:hypothetical protein
VQSNREPIEFPGEDFMRRFTTLSAFLLTALLLTLPALAQQDVITTAIGGGPNNMPAIDANLYNPYGVAVDTSGNFYIASYNQHRVFKVTPGGTLSVVAGSGAQGYAGDGIVGGAGNASLYHPYAVAVDSSNNVYIADQYNCVVRKVDTAKTITTIAGVAGHCGYLGDGGKGTVANLYYPSGVAVDSFGNMYIGDNNNCRVRKLVLANNNISTYAGNGSCGYSGDGGAATSAMLYTPTGVAVDSAGNLFIADSSNVVIREVTKSNGKISTVAGNHTAGFTGDGGPATSAEINQVFGLGVNGAGTQVTIADYYNQRIRQFTVGGNINTVAGTGTAGFSGDGGAATSAQINSPVGIAVGSGTIYVADNNNMRIRSFTVGGNINTVAGNGSPTVETLLNGVAPSGVVLQFPYGIFEDGSSNVYVTESNSYMVRELVHSSNLVNFFAGNGTYGYLGDGGAAVSAEITQPHGVAKDSNGNVYIADEQNCVIRMVNNAGVISTFAGIPQHCGFIGDGGPATSAELWNPWGVFVDSSNSVYIADYSNFVIRKVTGGTISTIAGIGRIQGYSGDGGPATSAVLNQVEAVTVDKAGNVFIADRYNCRIREVYAATGIINTVAGTGACGFSGDGTATANYLNYPAGIAVDANDNLFIGDTNNMRVRWVSPSGIMTTIAGTGTASYSGDGGLATSATMYYPAGVTLDPSGNILFSDYQNLRVRSISAFAALNSNTSSLNFGVTSVGSTSTAQVVTLSALGPLTITDITASASFSEADNCPATMTNGSKCTMYVYFTPTGSGTLTGTVTINTNGFFQPVTTISLTGLGSAISLAGAPVNFGNQLVKTTSAAKTVTVKNNGSTAVTMGAITLNETVDFTIASNTCPASGSNLAGGASCTIGVTFKPQQTGLKKGTISVNDNDPTSPQLIGLSGTGISNITLTPGSVTFASTPVGTTSASTKVTLTNTSGVSITLGNPAVTVTGKFANASTTTCTNGLVVAASGTCIINVTFKPTATGYTTGLLSVADSDVTSPQTVTLAGTGTGVKFTPPSVNFGTVNRGTQVSSTVTITNVGSSPVFFAGAEIFGPNSPDFSDNYANNPPCGNNSGNPLQPGATCTLTVYFLPSKVGNESATYKLFDNSPGSPQGLPLTGKGQ